MRISLSIACAIARSACCASTGSSSELSTAVISLSGSRKPLVRAYAHGLSTRGMARSVIIQRVQIIENFVDMNRRLETIWRAQGGAGCNR